MYRGFNLDLRVDLDMYFATGNNLFQESKVSIHETLDYFISSSGSINASDLQKHWFPQIKADVFISHSHKDEHLAISLAGLLSEELGITSFIDSSIWGYSVDLLREIDNKYCTDNGGKTYYYSLRNFSTSHVHMMLSTALAMMIDRTECIFFLNTPNSIHSSEVIKKTASPWLYAEIAMTQMIERKKLSYYRPDRAKAFSRMNEDLDFEYLVNLDHLSHITERDLKRWVQGYSFHEKYALDELYRISPANSKA